MAGPWLYVISAAGGKKFDLGGGKPLIDVTVESYRALVQSGEIGDDRYWYIWQHWKEIARGDELFIYSGDKDLGIIGYATIKGVEKRSSRWCILPDFDLEKSRSLLRQPVAAAAVRTWKVNLRKNVINLAPVERQLRALLPMPSFAPPINVEDQELSDDDIDQALRTNRLRFGDGVVATGSQQALVRQRKGQRRLHMLTVENYAAQCAVCDVTDQAFLIASHVVGWAEAPEHRGNLSNVICLCRIHDALFEAGYWSLANDLKLLKKASVKSETIRHVLDRMISFRSPADFAPAPRFLRRHRKSVGFAV